MNKTIALLIVGVILLAMALIMVNQYVTQTEGTAPASSVTALTTVPPTPSSASPHEVLSQLEHRAASSELASGEQGTVVSPPMPQGMPQNAPQARPQGMPSWAANGAVNGAANGTANGQGSGLALSSPSGNVSASGVENKPVETVVQESGKAPSPVAKVEAAKPKVAPAKPEATKPEAAKVEAAKPKPAKPETVKPEPVKIEQPKAKAPKTIKKIAVFRIGDEVAVRVDGSEAMEYKTMHLKSPERLVVDIEGVWAVKAPGVPDNKYVSNVRIGKQSDKTRIVIDLKQVPQAVKYVKRGSEGVDVRIK